MFWVDLVFGCWVFSRVFSDVFSQHQVSTRVNTTRWKHKVSRVGCRFTLSVTLNSCVLLGSCPGFPPLQPGRESGAADALKFTDAMQETPLSPGPIARLSVQKQCASEASRKAAEQAGAAALSVEGGWVSKALSSIGLLQANGSDLSELRELRAAQAAAMIASHTFLEKAAAEEKARAAAAKTAVQEAEREAQEGLATEAAEQEELQRLRREAEQHRAVRQQSAPVEVVLSAAAAKLTDANDDTRSSLGFGEFESAPCASVADVAPESSPKAPASHAAEANPVEAPASDAAVMSVAPQAEAESGAPQLEGATAMAAASPARAPRESFDEAAAVEAAADLKKVVWSDDEGGDGSDEGGEAAFRPAMKVGRALGPLHAAPSSTPALSTRRQKHHTACKAVTHTSVSRTGMYAGGHQGQGGGDHAEPLRELAIRAAAQVRRAASRIRIGAGGIGSGVAHAGRAAHPRRLRGSGLAGRRRPNRAAGGRGRCRVQAGRG